MSEAAADEIEFQSPLKHASVKKMLSITGTGLLGMVCAAWVWADGTTKAVARQDVVNARQDVILQGDGPNDPGLSQRVRELERDAAASNARRQEDHERLARIEDAVNRVVEKVGARK